MVLLVIVGIVILLGILNVIVEKFDKAKRFDQHVAKYGELEKFRAETEKRHVESEKEIAEAEQKGFRRAWRWRGVKQSGL